MASDLRRYTVSRSDSISRHKEIGTITAVGSTGGSKRASTRTEAGRCNRP